MSPGDIFCALTVGVLVIAWTSGNHVVQKVALLLLAEWATTNVAYQALGPHRAMLVIPSVNFGLASICAIVGFNHKSKLALVVFLLYGVVGVAHDIAFVTRQDGTYHHYVVLNVLFAMQLLAVGATGAWMAVRRWIAWRRQRPRFDNPRGASVA